MMGDWKNDDLDLDDEPEKNEKEEWGHDPFTALMFGSRATDRHGRQIHQPAAQEQGINYEELMLNIDKLMESAKGLKPLFQKIYPVIEQFWKKK